MNDNPDRHPTTAEALSDWRAAEQAKNNALIADGAYPLTEWSDVHGRRGPGFMLESVTTAPPTTAAARMNPTR